MTVNAFVLNALQTTDRKPAIRQAEPPAHVPPRPTATIAQQLTLAGWAMARAELLNEALHGAIMLCYERDTDGSLANVDRDDRIRVPLPWGSDGRKYWQLRRLEADVLRAVLLAWQTPQPGQPVPLWSFDAQTRAWYLNLSDYPAVQDALGWLRQRSVTSKAFKQQYDRIRQAERERPRRSR
jgi:hypothetical protein